MTSNITLGNAGGKKGKSIQQELLLAQLQVEQHVKIFIMVEEEKRRKAGE